MRIYNEQEYDYLDPFSHKVLKNTYNSIENRNLFPVLTAVVMDTDTKEAYRENEHFLIDTGASMSILRSEYKQFLMKRKKIDQYTVQYGAGEPRDLDVYKISLLIKGYEIPILAAFDPHFILPNNSIIGNAYGLREIGIFVANHKTNQSKIIKL